MKLKRVRIYGFKTFAEKTEIDLQGSIISVVGPNGCGKSNIVDAILWGLGETNARSLRAQSAQEVIFNGSANRKPLGYSEVSLFFDNEAGDLPIDTPEVVITRRLTRGGDSVYQINRRNCRLKDISDLLADSGLGRAGYAIVGQSEIDQALAASATQRRGWIDEAAGVQRYRMRRQEAQRRMASTNENLSRVHDLIQELDLQMGPLQAEAEVARQARALMTELKQTEVGLLAKEIRDAQGLLVDLKQRQKNAQSEAEELVKKLGELEIAKTRALADQEQMEARIEELRDNVMRLQSLVNQAESQKKLSESKLEGLNDLEGQLAEEAGGHEARVALATQDLAQAEVDLTEAQTQLSELSNQMASVDQESGRLTQELTRLERELSQAQAALKEWQKHEVESAHRDERLKHLRIELEGILATLPDLEKGIEEAQTNQSEAEAKELAGKQEIAAVQEELRTLELKQQEANTASARAATEMAGLEGRMRGLTATLESYEGLAQGARAVLTAKEQGHLKGSYVPVAGAISVEGDLALALDTALGGAANDLIVPDEGHAKRAIEFLKQNRLGRATFQPITLMRPNYPSDELSRMKRSPGVVGLASELVKCDPVNRPVIDSLLGRILIVEDLDSALALARTKGWSRMVTMDGEVVHSSGAVTGGAARHQGSGLVQRRAELSELERSAKEQQEKLEKIKKARQSWDDARQRLLIKLQTTQASAKALREEVEETRSWTSSLNHELNATKKSLQRLQLEEEQLTKGTEKPTGDLPKVAELQTERDETMKLLAQRQADAQSSLTLRRELEAKVTGAKSRVLELKRRLEILDEAEGTRSRRAHGLESERERLRALQNEAVEDSVRLAEELKQSREDLESAQQARKVLAQEAADCHEKISQSQSADLALTNTLHQIELQKARAEGKKATATERLLEEYGLGEQESLDLHADEELPADAAQQVSRLRRELKSLGEVNLGAVEAFERLEIRHSELTQQVEDIESGLREIEAGIKELDRLTRDRFMATFVRLQEEFSSMFNRIFHGGEGSLELCEGENILDAGVDISVTIPGKRRQRLELLSGGERALSALAFLFALLRVKPSPLVILDEVDAPLDGRNVERFIAMMRELSESTQFILITHNNVTIESADVWFGVTMQEPGVSTVVPFRAPQTVAKAAAQKQVEPDEGISTVGQGLTLIPAT